MKRTFFSILACSALLASCTSLSKVSSEQEHDITFVVAADLHFDHLPESDQFCHVVAMNRLEKHFVWPDKSLFAGDSIKKLSSVIIAGDIFDKPLPEIIELFKVRYLAGKGDRSLNYICYPGYGNHDINPFSKDSVMNMKGRENALALMDSIIYTRYMNRKIDAYDPSSRNYSWTDQGVHFLNLQTFGGDTTYCTSSFDWLERNLSQNASDGKPVVVVQHYGFDHWAREWWPSESRERLFDILEPYNVKAMFVGHTHESSVQEHRGVKIYQVNNAWPDQSGKASFCVARLKNNNMSMVNCQWTDSLGTFELTDPILNIVSE